MNIMFFLTHKSEVTYLYEDMGIKEGLDKLQASGYHAIPLISRDGEYIGTVTEGDFLWMICSCGELLDWQEEDHVAANARFAAAL